MERIFNSISFHSRDRMQLGNFKGRGGGDGGEPKMVAADKNQYGFYIIKPNKLFQTTNK